MVTLRPQSGLLWNINSQPHPRDAYNSAMVGFLRDSSSKFTCSHQLRLDSKGFVILDRTPSRIKWVLSKENRLKFCGKFATSDPCKRVCIIISLAGSEDGIPVQDGSYTKVGDGWDEARMKLNASLQGGESEVYPVQILHEAARKFQLAMEQQGSLKKNGWFAKSWLGVDQNSWIKPLAYQAAVHALLRAALEIASRGEGRDRDAHIFVQRSIVRLSNPLEESINQELSSRDPAAEDWFWSEQHPIAVAGFVDMLERDSRFIAVTSIGWEGALLNLSKASDAALLTLAISNTAAVMKLGPAKLSCPPFISTLTDETSRLMNMLTELIPIDQVYHFTHGVGLRREFLRYFGPRAVAYRYDRDIGGEGAFWVDLVQQLLRGAISREHIKSKLTSYDSIEVLERDLSVFGFFAALGRRTRCFLAAKNVGDSDELLAGLLRYLIGGSVLFYPQLASLNTYQLFVELVCEEMDWLPLYPFIPPMQSHTRQEEGTSQAVELAKREAISTALDSCSRWIGDFVQYCTWIQQPSGARASRFLLNSRNRLDACLEAFCLPTQQVKPGREMLNIAAAQLEYNHGQMPYQDYWECMTENVELSKKLNDQQTENGGFQKMYQQLNLFDKELQRVDEVVSRLDSLLKEPDRGPGKHHLTAACTNLEKIRKLKREVENLEASLRAKASAMQQAQDDATSQRYGLQRGGSARRSFNLTESSDGQQTKNRKVGSSDNFGSKAQGLGRFLPFWSYNKTEPDQNRSLANCGTSEEDTFEQDAAIALQEASTVSIEIQRFEILRRELMDLEKRIHGCAGDNANEKETVCELTKGDNDSKSLSRIVVTDADSSASGDVFGKSLVKIKEATTDVWRGTQLLATDVAAAIVLLKRSVSGDKLTEREKKVLKRTLTDLASVVPIGFLMLLPVTAVGHAAILAAIQRYAPALIPSAYAPERLDLLRQLEQVRHMEVDTVGDTKASLVSSSVNKGESKVSS